ncbi:MAG: hypothetical protein ABH854_03050 [Candidatus Diapherotrites archaeon]|nr:hypothetical protein [Candidatus Micrarchaeota archaeon]
MKTKLFVLFAAAVLLMAFLSGCAAPAEPEPTGPTADGEITSEEEAEKAVTDMSMEIEGLVGDIENIDAELG